MADYAGLRMQAEPRRQGRYVGIGLATAHQRSVYGPTEFWFWYDSPGLTSVPESIGLTLGPTGEFVVTMFSPVWDSPETVAGQMLAKEFGIDPAQVIMAYEGSIHGLECVNDEQGQPPASSFMDYLLPTAMEVPKFEIGHVQTPSPFTQYGVKGGGEGGRMTAPAAVASAVEDALALLGVRVDDLPMTPERIVSWIEASHPLT